MSGTTRVELFGGANENYDRKPTAEELATVPAMTKEDCREIMKTREYRESSLVRALVAASIAKSDLSTQAPTRFDGRPQEQAQTGDEVLAKRETVAAMMRNSKYKTDPLYRLEISQKIASLTASDNTGITAQDLKTPNRSVSLGVSTSPFHGADLQVRKFQRVELAAKADDSQAPVKPATPVKEPFS
ncbi:MAG: hypothetical protein A4E19_17985 [Nitrospira sp. SG-bin1]|nr:MAG: hypothetical protein A4E19_17985 [Nitrospira sp. SG-bin1]